MVDSITLIGAGAPLPEGGTNTCISYMCLEIKYTGFTNSEGELKQLWLSCLFYRYGEGTTRLLTTIFAFNCL